MKSSRRLAAIMFTDIVGYTSLMGSNEDKAFQLLQQNRSLHLRIIEKHNGTLHKEMGDGLLFSFSSALHAVQCAIELQNLIKDEPDHNLKIGIHLGDVTFMDNDVFGDGVNIASRLESLGSSGSILISQSVYSNIKNKEEIRTVFIGEADLKNVDTPLNVYHVLTNDPLTTDLSAIKINRTAAQLKASKAPPTYDTSGYSVLTRQFRRPHIGLLVFIGIILVAGVVYFPIQRLFKVQQTVTQIRDIENFAQAGQYFDAYQLALKVEKLLDDDTTLLRLMPIISDKINIISEPAGARFSLSRFNPATIGQKSEIEYIGVTPVTDLSIARSDYKVSIEKEGFVTAERMASSALNRNEVTFGVSPDIHLEVKLQRVNEAPENMVLVEGGDYRLVSSDAPTRNEVKLSDYFIDKFEVSNKKFKEFIVAGGYSDIKFWKFPFIKDGIEISWEEGVKNFVDQTGLPGPRNWSIQQFQEGKSNYPVTEINWYEAAAYAEFKDKRLPTIYEWEKAARNGNFTHFTGRIMPWGLLNNSRPSEGRSNVSGKGTTPVGSYEFGISSFGCHDMAGNVKEWCLNETVDGFLTTGGSWEEPDYMFSEFGTLPGFYSSQTVGFRCVKMSTDGTFDQSGTWLDITTLIPSYTPVDNATFEGFLSHYKYDRKQLDVQIEEVVETEDWIREKVTFAGIDNDRIIAYLFLPKRATKPFQCLSFMPGYDIFLGRTTPEYIEWFLAPHIKAGRAVWGVVPKGAVERPFKQEPIVPSRTSVSYRDRIIYWSTEFSIGLDYLATREDIDMDRISHIGFSMGSSWVGIMHTAVERRYRSIVFVGAGIIPWLVSVLPEVNQVNFAPRIEAPKLVLQGKYDEVIVYSTMTKPFYDMLPQPKRLALVDGGHMPPLELRVPIINNWLDETLGPVKY